MVVSVVGQVVELSCAAEMSRNYKGPQGVLLSMFEERHDRHSSLKPASCHNEGSQHCTMCDEQKLLCSSRSTSECTQDCPPSKNPVSTASRALTEPPNQHHDQGTPVSHQHGKVLSLSCPVGLRADGLLP